jgi:hypothetical protein
MHADGRITRRPHAATQRGRCRRRRSIHGRWGLEHEPPHGGRPRPYGRSACATAVQAQRRKAWGEPPPVAASSVTRPRPYGRSACATAVQAQRRKAWGEPPPDAASSVTRPRPYGRSACATAVQAQRREAWGEPPPDAASSVIRPRPYGGRLVQLPYKPNAVRRGARPGQSRVQRGAPAALRPVGLNTNPCVGGARGLTAGRLSGHRTSHGNRCDAERHTG